MKLRLALAKDKLHSARLLLKEGQYRDAISRAYYAMFYAARAVILLKHYRERDPKSHQGVKTLFNKYFIKTEIVEKSFSKMFQIAEEARQDADYKEKARIEKKDAQEIVDMAEQFVKKMGAVAKEYLSKI